jgi:hypothetical protein
MAYYYRSDQATMLDFLLNTAVIVPILTFVVGYIAREWKKLRDERIARRKYLLALCVEIELNTDSLDIAIRSIPATSTFRQFLLSGPPAHRGAAGTTTPAAVIDPVCYRPHLINTYLDHIFKQNIGVLAEMPDRVIRSIIDFYGKLDWIDIIVNSIEKQSFASISVGGREAILERLRIAMHEARQQGTEILGAIRLILNPRRTL